MAFASSQADQLTDTAKPSRQIDLAKLGYQGLSAEGRLMTTANVTLNFVDDNHVLLTFNPKKLFQRDPACPPSHKDRIIQAQIIELGTGKVVREASWYLHDEHRYLWPLAEGHFLLRKLNSLYELDSGLHEKLLLESPKPLLWTGVTPDGKQIMTETAADDSGKVRNPAKTKVRIDFLGVPSLAVQRTIRISQVLPLQATSLGFGDALHSMASGVWLVRFGSGAKDRNYVTRVKSRCVPDLLFPTNNTMFVGRCSAEGSDYSVSIFTLTGHFLWREKWNQHRYEPVIERSEDGSRIAISTLVGATPDGTALPEDQEWPQVQQSFRVVDAATGTPVLTTKSASAVLKGQNFALSPNGNQFAALDGSILELFDLPPMSTEERVKYVALQADAPTLTTPASRNSAETSGSDSDEVFDVAEQGASEDSPKPPPVVAPGVAPPDASSPPQQAAAQKPDSADPHSTDASVVTFKVASKTVVVDVVVTDSKGHTVKGLPPEDFQVQEDGKPQRVNYFHEFVGYDVAGSSGPGPSEPAPAADKLPPNIFSNNQLTREDAPVTVVLFDLLNTPPENQAFAREQLITVLKNKPPGSQFALCTLGGHLQLIQGFTTDEKLLVATANGKKGATHYNSLMERDTGLQKGLEMQKEIAAVDPNMQFVVQVFQQAAAEQRAQELDMRVNLTVDAFAQLARYLGGVPGRKSIIWLSASFPLGIFPNNDLVDAFSESRNYTALMKKTANLLAEAHVSVYPVDVRGLTTEGTFAATAHFNLGVGGPGSSTPVPAAAGLGGSTGITANTAANAAQTNPIMQSTKESLENQIGEQSTMDQIAADTGGKAFYNTNGIKEAIQSAAEQGSNYYMLSYTPANHNYDGKFRKLKVQLAAKGYHMAYRHGYYADDPFAPIPEEKDALARDVGVAAMQHGSPQSHQIVFATRVIPIGKPAKVDPTKDASGKKPKKNAPVITAVQHYAVDYAIAGPQLHFVDQGNVHHGVLAFMASAFDDDGKSLSRVASRTTSDLKPSAYKDVMVGGFRIHQEFDVPVNATSLRLGVEDELNRRLGTLEISLPVPQPPEQAGLRAKTLPDIEPN